MDQQEIYRRALYHLTHNYIPRDRRSMLWIAKLFTMFYIVAAAAFSAGFIVGNNDDRAGLDGIHVECVPGAPSNAIQTATHTSITEGNL